MAARFAVGRTFVMDDRGLFAVAGVIEEGMVEMGMTATLAGREDAFSRRVHSVELLGDPTLCFSYSSQEKLSAWQALDWDGGTLTLTW